MNWKSVYVSWFDLLVVVVLILGIKQGQKKGLSQELLDLAQWLAIVVLAGILYDPVGRFLAGNTVFSLLSAYIFSYVLIALSIKLMFSTIRKGVGEKLMQKDAFGRGEYYMGMAAGAVRCGCALVLAMALLNARLYTKREVQARAAYHENVYGSQFFPSLADFQAEVFGRSWSGRFTREYLSMVLIRPTPPQGKQPDRRAVRAREQAVNEMLDRR